MKKLLLLLLLPGVLSAADITTSQSFIDGDSVTAAKLNNITAGATIAGSFIDGKSSGTPITSDEILFYQISSAGLRKATLASLTTLLYTSPSLSGNVLNSGSEAWTGTVTAAITADQNNYAPTGFSTATTLRLAPDAARSITGLAGGTAGLLILVHNTSATFNLTLVDESAASTSANRFALTHDIIVPPDGITLLQYDATSLRWRSTASHVHTSADITDYLTINPSYTPLTDGATVTVTCSATKPSQNATVTLGGNRALAISGATNGMQGILIVKQDGTGTRTLTLPATSKVTTGGAGVITLTTTANAIDALSWTFDGTNYFWSYGKNFN